MVVVSMLVVVMMAVTMFMMKVVKEGQALDFCTEPTCPKLMP